MADLKPSPDYQLESRWPEGSVVIGVDEAGRGPWAGPVTAAAFWISPEHLAALPSGLTDSKKLSARMRADIETALAAQPHRFAVASKSAADIDADGLLPATFGAMNAAIAALAPTLPGPIDAVLVDGHILPDLPAAGAADCEAIIRGDALSLSIAAASVMAKQDRDRQMQALEAVWPGYGFAAHKGYGTKAHQQALDALGPCAEHRRSFRPIAMRLNLA